MSQSLLAIVGSIMIDEHFRDALKANPASALSRYGIILSRKEHEVLGKILASVRSDVLDGAFNLIRIECPQWPCDEMKLVPYDEVGGIPKI